MSTNTEHSGHIAFWYLVCCKILKTVLNFYWANYFIICHFRYWPIICLTFTIFQSMHSDDDFSDRGKLAKFEQLHIYCLHPFFFYQTIQRNRVLQTQYFCRYVFLLLISESLSLHWPPTLPLLSQVIWAEDQVYGAYCTAHHIQKTHWRNIHISQNQC